MIGGYQRGLAAAPWWNGELSSPGGRKRQAPDPTRGPETGASRSTPFSALKGASPRVESNQSIIMLQKQATTCQWMGWHPVMPGDLHSSRHCTWRSATLSLDSHWATGSRPTCPTHSCSKSALPRSWRCHYSGWHGFAEQDVWVPTAGTAGTSGRNPGWDHRCSRGGSNGCGLGNR